MKQITKKLCMLLLAVAMLLPALGGLELKAAEKPEIMTDHETIGIGSYGTYMDCVYSKKYLYVIEVINQKKGATYTFESKNKKIVTVAGKKNKGYLTGIKAGKAKIVVTENYKGKKTVVGDKTITVKNSSVAKYGTAVMGIGTATLNPYGDGTLCMINYFNPEAKYTYECNDENVAIKDVREADTTFGEKGMKHYTQQYTAKKEGTYTVTVKETYKKKTRKVGTFKVQFKKAYIEGKEELTEGETFVLGWHVRCLGGSEYYYDESKFAADGILKENADGEIEAVKAGETGIDIYYYDAKTDGPGEFIGTLKVVVTSDDSYDEEDYE